MTPHFDRKKNVTYEKFKSMMPFGWEEPKKVELHPIDWEAKKRQHEKMKTSKVVREYKA